ncbi:MAG: sigma-70 family RNA polymerase sigma factor [Xanthomonadaceae bacterium]|nr:sigma-70 family RNA polymerase sigma factor [Xanthomonadaceae bacterium]
MSLDIVNDVPLESPLSVTTLLERVRHGDSQAWNKLYASLYGDLYRIARAQLRSTSGHTLTPTSLINETWLRLARKRDVLATDKQQLVGLVVSAMRKAILDEIRRRRADKRGGGACAVALDIEGMAPADSRETIDMLALDASIEALRVHQPRLAQVVEWRYFGGMSESEIASVLGLHERTVRRDWQAARLFLAQRLRGRVGDER